MGQDFLSVVLYDRRSIEIISRWGLKFIRLLAGWSMILIARQNHKALSFTFHCLKPLYTLVIYHLTNKFVKNNNKDNVITESAPPTNLTVNCLRPYHPSSLFKSPKLTVL